MRRGFFDNNYFPDDYGMPMRGSRPPPPPPKPEMHHCNCGELRMNHIGGFVELAGRVHKMQIGRFIQLRDAYGTTQLVISETRSDLTKRFTNLPIQSYIVVQGYVQARPPRSCNEKLDTGLIEVMITNLLMVKVNRETREVNQTMQKQYSNSVEITSEEYIKFGPLIGAKVKERQYTCASPLKDSLNNEVVLHGWTDGKSLPKFIQLRDGYGVVQCVLPDNDPNILHTIEQINIKSILAITGTVVLRPQPRVHNMQINGTIELRAHTVEILKPDVSQYVEEETNDGNESALCKVGDRTHTCGELRTEHVGQKTRICGWLETLRPRFITLTDLYGSTQCIFADESTGVSILSIPIGSVLVVEGIVNARPPSAQQVKKTATGDVEVLITNLEVLNKATVVPFQAKGNSRESREAVTHKHRFFSLRSKHIQNNLRVKSSILMGIRKCLIDSHGFLELDTPTPSKTEEEYAINPHYNQLLMAGRIDRCFQITRRHGDAPSRLSESMELDLEMSFATFDDILNLVEELLVTNFFPTGIARPFQKITYEEALKTYGSVDPDITYSLKLRDITALLKDSLTDIPEDFGAYILVAEGGLLLSFNTALEKTVATNFPGIKFLQHKVTQSVNAFITKALSDELNSDVVKSIVSASNLKRNNCFYIAYGSSEQSCLCLGYCRTAVAKELQKSNMLNKNTDLIAPPLWITDFPLFTKDLNGKVKSYFHPSTAPVDSDIPLQNELALKMRGLSFRLIIGGQRIVSGAIRIHSAATQQRILSLLSIPESSFEEILDALKSGCPPHGGINLDVTRLLTMTLGEEFVNNIIAFPNDTNENGQTECLTMDICESDTPVAKKCKLK